MAKFYIGCSADGFVKVHDEDMRPIHFGHDNWQSWIDEIEVSYGFPLGCMMEFELKPPTQSHPEEQHDSTTSENEQSHESL